MARQMVLDAVVATAKPASGKSLLRRLYDGYVNWFVASQHARTDSEIERFIAARGGVLTDEIERDISRKFGSGMIGG